MQLDFETGKLICGGKNITPPTIFNEKFEQNLNVVFPQMRKLCGDHQRWLWLSIGQDSLLILNHYELYVRFNYQWDWTKNESPRFTYLLACFTDNFIKNKIFKNEKLSYHEKLKRVKFAYLELFEKMTDHHLEIDKRNVISFPSWGRAHLIRKKKVFYEMRIYWLNREKN